MAASRLGAQTTMLAQVGDDEDGNNYIQFMANEGIDTSKIKKLQGVMTG